LALAAILTYTILDPNPQIEIYDCTLSSHSRASILGFGLDNLLPYLLNPKYAIEITSLPQIIDSWVFTAYALMHLWVHLKYVANTHEPSISRIFGNSVA
jgi:hypothetical protein